MSNGLFAAVGRVEPASVKLNNGRYSAMFRVADDRFYLCGLTNKPAAGDLFVFGRLYSFTGKTCGQLHVGVRPMAVLPAGEVSPGLVSSLVSQWMSVAVGY